MPAKCRKLGVDLDKKPLEGGNHGRDLMPEIQRKGSGSEGTSDPMSAWVDDNRTPRAGLRGNVQVLPSLAASDGTRVMGPAGRRQADSDDDNLRSRTMADLAQDDCGTAQDVRNLLGGVVLRLSHLRGQQHSKKLEAMLDSALQAARQGLCAMQSLLAVARYRPSRSGILDPNACIQRIEPLLHEAIGFAVQLVLVLEPGIWKVKVNVDAAVLALVSLSTNARDAMPQGGLLRVGTANVALRGEIGGLNGEFVAITVADNGTGMPEHVRARAFESLSPATPVGNGHRLGLTQVRELARRARGAVLISSAAGRGTAVTLYLPRAAAACARSESTVQR
jgi:signal transduction histidine kinase